MQKKVKHEHEKNLKTKERGEKNNKFMWNEKKHIGTQRHVECMRVWEILVFKHVRSLNSESKSSGGVICIWLDWVFFWPCLHFTNWASSLLLEKSFQIFSLSFDLPSPIRVTLYYAKKGKLVSFCVCCRISEKMWIERALGALCFVIIFASSWMSSSYTNSHNKCPCSHK